MAEIFVKTIKRKTTVSRLAVRRAVAAVYRENQEHGDAIGGDKVVVVTPKAAGSSSATKKKLSAGTATVLGKRNTRQPAQATKIVSGATIKPKKAVSLLRLKSKN
jgi:RNase P protein component